MFSPSFFLFLFLYCEFNVAWHLFLTIQVFRMPPQSKLPTLWKPTTIEPSLLTLRPPTESTTTGRMDFLVRLDIQMQIMQNAKFKMQNFV